MKIKIKTRNIPYHGFKFADSSGSQYTLKYLPGEDKYTIADPKYDSLRYSEGDIGSYLSQGVWKKV